MLQETYKRDIHTKLMSQLGLKNPMQVPRLMKIVLNTCMPDAVQNSKVIEAYAEEIALIAGQKPRVCRAKKAIAAFKLREGIPIALMVTLRRERMYEFFSRLVNVALPRSRDFKGLSRKGFDGRGNYSMGVSEHIMFPEIVTDKVEKNRGFNITIVTSAKNDQEGEALLRAMGLPLRT